MVEDRAGRVRHDHRRRAAGADRRSPALTAGGAAGFWLASQRRHRARVRVRLELAALAGHRAGDHVLRGAGLLPAPRREAEVQVHHARLGDRYADLAGGHLGLLGQYAGPLRQLQRHLRIDRRRDRAADLVLHQRLHFPDGRRDERDHRARVPRGEGQRRARARARRRRRRANARARCRSGAADSAAAAARTKGGIPADAQEAHR